MPENVKEKNIEDKETEEADNKSAETEKRSYYYDDACGYEIYKDEDEEDDEDS